MGTGVIQEDAEKQAEMEAHLLQIWAQGCPETKTVEEVFGPYESWLFPLGTHLLLLHPALKEWLYFDKLHETWERTGFGPGEVVFVAQGKLLGVRRKKDTSVPPIMAEQRSVIAASDATLTTSGWRLTIANGPNAGQSFPLGDRVRLGREAGNDIRLADRRVSRHHAILERVGPGYLITDQGSSNGTYVNGVRISQPTALHSGDMITIGDTQFTILGEIQPAPTGTQETLVCPACGARIASKFCTQCGARLG